MTPDDFVFDDILDILDRDDIPTTEEVWEDSK